MISTQAYTQYSLKLAYILSLAIGLLMAGVSLAGLMYPSSLYPTDELRNSFVANDAINLTIGLPILLGSMWLTWRGKLVGLLLWPGALLYILYNYIAYIFGIRFNAISFVYLALVLLSAYVIFDLLRNIDKNFVQQQLAGVVPVRTSAWVLVGLGALFTLRALGMIVQARLDQIALPTSDVGVLIADMVLSMLWIAGGVLLLLRKPLGYTSGLGLLFAGSMLFISLIVFLLLRPVLTDAPFALTDVIVVLIMGFICFIPFFLFVRGMLSKAKSEGLQI